MEREYIKNVEKLKDVYVRVEIGTWYDDEDNEHKEGVCYGHVKEFAPHKWDNEDEQYYDVLECYETILADGEVTYNDDLGTEHSNKFSYMTDEEKIWFIEKVTKKHKFLFSNIGKLVSKIKN